MNSKRALVLEQSSEGEWVRISLVGPINEDAKAVLTPLLAAAPKKCILDLGQVTQLSSIGIRDWSLCVKALKVDCELVFEKLPDEVVRTINMVPNFRAKLPVRSVLRTHSCNACKAEQVELFSEGRDFQHGQIPETKPRQCNSCGQATEPLEDDETFFIFLLSA